MESPIPPDPYTALGISNDAQPNEIKSAYRKLVLRCHPDKITDETAKAKAVDEFHKVQQAYELIGDEEKRGRYDALVRLAELRRQKMEMSDPGPRTNARAAAYDTRTAAPPSNYFTARGPTRASTFDDRRPSYYSDEDVSRASARKSTRDYAYVRKSPMEREREKERERDSERARRDDDRRRNDRRRDVDREADRSSKYATTSKDEDFSRFEEGRRQRDRDEKEQLRKSPLRREDTNERITRVQDEAQAYMQDKSRPSYSRTTSSQNVSYAYVRRPAPEARERRSARESSPRDGRRGPEIVDLPRPSTLRPQSSDPAGVAGAAYRKPEPHRSYTTQSNFDHRRDADVPSPYSIHRSYTMPVPQEAASSRRAPPPTKLRTTELSDSTRSDPVSPDRQFPPPPPGPPPSSKSAQYYPDPEGTSRGSASRDYDTIVREPVSSNTSARRVSPPRERASKSSSTKTANMMANLASSSRPTSKRTSTYGSYAEGPTSRASPRMTRSPERMSPREDRERSRRDRYREEPVRPKLYGEVSGSSFTSARDPRSRTSYGHEDVSYSTRYGPEHVAYSYGRDSRDSRGDSDYGRPPRLSRQGTAVY